LFWKRRQTHQGDRTLTDPDPNILVSNVDRRPVVGATYRPSTLIDPDPNTEVDHVPVVGANHHPSSNDSPSILPTRPLPNQPRSHHISAFLDPNIPHSSSTIPSTLPVSTLLPSANRISKVNDAILTAPGPSSALVQDSALATQETRFLLHLYDNAPAEEIAESMQTRARQGASTDVGIERTRCQC
jgi:hypothetical protein